MFFLNSFQKKDAYEEGLEVKLPQWSRKHCNDFKLQQVLLLEAHLAHWTHFSGDGMLHASYILSLESNNACFCYSATDYFIS